MEYLVVISLLVLAHVISDFFLQSNQMARGKGTSWGVLLGHVAVGVLAAILISILFFSVNLLKVILVLGGLHLVVDKIRGIFDQRYSRWKFESFLLDQIIHLLAIVLSYPWLKSISLNNTIISSLARLPYIEYYKEIGQVSEYQWVVIIIVISVYLFNIRGANFLVQQAISQYTPDDVSETLASEFIGRLERFIIVTFVLIDAYTAIAMVFAAKSIARLKEFENKDFAQYYIVGTLASTLTAILTGLFVKGVIFVLFHR